MLTDDKRLRDHQVSNLSTRLEEKLDKIIELLDRLEKESDKGKPILVEGNNDVASLRQLSIQGQIIPIKATSKNLIDILDEVIIKRTPEVILLMDFDRRGKKLTKRITRHLQESKIKPNLLFWKKLLSLVGRNVKDIEGLKTYIQNLNKRL